MFSDELCKVLIEVIFYIRANHPATLYSRKIMLEHESNLKSLPAMLIPARRSCSRAAKINN